MSTLEEHKAIARRFYEEVLNQGNLDLIDEIAAADMVDHGAVANGWESGQAGFRHHAEWFRGVFPSGHVTVDQLVAEGEWVVVFWTATGTQTQPLFGMPATGKQVSVSVVTTVRVRDGKIVEYHSRPDRRSFLQQIGAIISPPAPVPTT